jgi:hypothetical protein
MEKHMQTITLFFLFILFVGSASAYESTAKQAAIAAYFRSSEEPIVMDAAWTGSNIFRVGVIDNGENRSPLAYDVCKHLASKGIRNVTVDVIDIMVLKYQDEWKSLGRTYSCKD